MTRPPSDVWYSLLNASYVEKGDSFAFDEHIFWDLDQSPDLFERLREIRDPLEELGNSISGWIRDDPATFSHIKGFFERQATEQAAAQRAEAQKEELTKFLARREEHRARLLKKMERRIAVRTDPDRWSLDLPGPKPIEFTICRPLLDTITVYSLRAILRGCALHNRGASIRVMHPMFSRGEPDVEAKRLGDPLWMDALPGATRDVRLACWIELAGRLDRNAAVKLLRLLINDPRVLITALEPKTRFGIKNDLLSFVGVDAARFWELLYTNGRRGPEDKAQTIGDLIRADCAFVLGCQFDSDRKSVLANGVPDFGISEIDNWLFDFPELI
jgi:hypothetical protein